MSAHIHTISRMECVAQIATLTARIASWRAVHAHVPAKVARRIGAPLSDAIEERDVLLRQLSDRQQQSLMRLLGYA